MVKMKMAFLPTLLVALAMALGLMSSLAVKADVAYASEVSKYSSSAVVALPSDGVVAKVSWLDGEDIKSETFGFTPGRATATRGDVNEELADAWQFALDHSYNGQDLIPSTIFADESFVEIDLYVDWIAVNGKFGSGGDGFDDGELEVDGLLADASLMLDLNGCTLDRGASQANPYGRVLDLANDSSRVALVSSGGKQGVVTGGWDGDGGAIRVGLAINLYMDNVHVTGNHAANGGAVFVGRSGLLKAMNCEFSYNTAESRGGAISNKTNLLYMFSLVDLSNCAFHHNTSQGLGGAIDINDTGNILRQETSFIRGCDIYANSAKTKGGGVFVECDSLLEIHGITRIYDNHAGEQGGGLFLESYANDDAEAILFGDVAAYGNTAGSDAFTSNVFLDSGTTSEARLVLDTTFKPSVATGLYSSECQVVAKSKLTSEQLTDELVQQWFFSDDPNRYVEKEYENSSTICTRDKSSDSAAIGDLISFVVESGLPGNTMPLPDNTVIDNEQRKVMLVFTTLNAVDLPDSLVFSVNTTLTAGSLVDLDCNGPDAAGGSETLSIDLSETPQGQFRVYDREGEQYEQWTVDVIRDGDLYSDTVMTVTDSQGTVYITTDAIGDPFASGWKLAIEKLVNSDVAVKLYRDWTAPQGVFSDDDHFAFDNGRLAVDNSNGRVMTIDLNGHGIDRNLGDSIQHGQVLRLSGHANVKIVDTSKQGGGAIVGGNNHGDGGAVYMVENARLTVEDVALSGNAAVRGAGVYMTDNARLTLKDGALIEGNAAEDGAGIYVAGDGAPNLAIAGGTLFGNVASDEGGAIYSDQGGMTGYLEMTAGAISGNTAKRGAGIYWNGDGTLNLIGGSIIENTAGSKGGGVFADSDGSDINIGGSLRIMMNLADGEDSNLTLEDESANLVQSHEFEEDAKVGVSMASGYGDDNKDQITAVPDTFRAGSSAYLRSDDPAYGVVAYVNEGDAEFEEIHLVKGSEKGQWEEYTLTLVDWLNGQEKVVETISAGEGDEVVLHADSSEDLVFISWDVEPEGQSATQYYSPTLTYVMPACNVVVRGNYMTYVGELAVSDVDQPKVCLPFDNVAKVEVKLPVDVNGDGNVDGDDAISFDDIVVAWTDSVGKPVDRPARAEIYTGTIVLLDGADHGIVFDDEVVVTGIDGAQVRVADGKCTITFQMEAQPAVMTESLVHEPSEALTVKVGTPVGDVLSQLPSSLNVMTDVGEIPVGVTWTCASYTPDAKGEYDFEAQFALDDAGVVQPEDIALSGTIKVKVVDSSVPLPVVDKRPGVYAVDSLEVVISVDELQGADEHQAASESQGVDESQNDSSHYDLFYMVECSDPNGQSIVDNYVNAGESATVDLVRNTEGALTYTIKAYVVPASASNGVSVASDLQQEVVSFQYTLEPAVVMYEVAVEGGMFGDGSTSGSFRAGTTITLNASELALGQYFAGWYKKGGTEAISMSPSYTLVVNESAVYEARYGARSIAGVEVYLDVPSVGESLDNQADCAFRCDGGRDFSGIAYGIWYVLNEDGSWSELEELAAAEHGSVYKVVLTFGDDGKNIDDDASFVLNGTALDEGWDAATDTLSHVFPATPPDNEGEGEGGEGGEGGDPDIPSEPGSGTGGGEPGEGTDPGAGAPGDGGGAGSSVVDDAKGDGDILIPATGDDVGRIAVAIAGVVALAAVIMIFASRRKA